MSATVNAAGTLKEAVAETKKNSEQKSLNPVRRLNLFPLRPFPSFLERGERFFQSSFARFRLFRSAEPDEIFALAGAREGAEVFCGAAVLRLRQRVFEKLRHRPGFAFYFWRGRDGGIGIKFHCGLQKILQRALIEICERCQAQAANVGVAGAAGFKELRRVGQFRAAKEGEPEMFLARADAADEFASRETKHVPFYGRAEVGLPIENPFGELFRDRFRECWAQLQPFCRIFRFGPGAIHNGAAG